VTGSEFYHSFPVAGRRGNRGVYATAGEYNKVPWAKDISNKSLLRNYFDEIKAGLRGEEYRDAVLMRPETPLTPKQKRVLQERIVERARQPYKTQQGVRGFLKDVFLPRTGVGPGKMVCEGNVCSTLPAQATYEATGRNVGEAFGKKPSEMLTADYLREGSGYKPVAARIASKPLSPATLKRLNIAGRGALGGALGLGAIGAIEEPELLAAPVGAAGLTIGARHALRNLMPLIEARRAGSKLTPKQLAAAQTKGYNIIRPATKFMDVLGGKGDYARGVMRNITRRTLPLGAAGGLGAYLLAKQFTD